MSNQEGAKRMFDIVAMAVQDEISPQEFVRRIIKDAIARNNPFIKLGDPFIIMGIDGFNGEMFFYGSSLTIEESLATIRKKQGEESFYSDGDDMSTTFHLFTREGTRVFVEEE